MNNVIPCIVKLFGVFVVVNVTLILNITIHILLKTYEDFKEYKNRLKKEDK